MTRKTFEERFWDKVDKNGILGCWIWTAARVNKYGVIGLFGKMVKAHRISWELHNGEIPNGLDVLHKCDNEYCVNPNHMFLGTQADNMHDMINKGRAAWQSGLAILTKKEVLEIRNATGTQQEIAEQYSVSQPTISNIKSNKSWKHLYN